MDTKPQPGAIPSPFMPDLDVAHSFMKEVETVAKKYGYGQIFIATGKQTSKTTGDFFSQSNALSEGMVECLRDSLRAMEKELKNFKDDNDGHNPRESD